jgi:outer membrane protein assembly factor BamB
VAARRSWVTLATLAVVAVSAAAGVVTWDAQVRPPTAEPAEPAPAWSAYLGSPANPVSSAAQVGSASIQPGPPLAPNLQLAGGTVHVRDGGRLRALDPVGGQERWRFPAGPDGPGTPEVVSFVADVDGTAVLARGRTGGGAPDGLVALLDPATGRPRWQRRVGGDVFPNSLAVGPAGIQLVAQDPLTFDQLIAKRQRADWSPVHVRLIALDRAGRPRWRRPLHEVTGDDDPVEDVRVTVAGSRVVAVSQRQHGARIEVFEAGTGVRSWSRPAERAGGVLAWRDRLLLDLGDRRPSVRARDGVPLRVDFLPAGAATPTSDPASSQLRGDILHVFAGGQLAAVDLAADRTRWQLRTGVAYYPPELVVGQREAFNASAVGERDGLVLVLARDRCLYVVDDQTGAAVGRHCGLHEPVSGSPLVATAETAVYLTSYGVVAYRLRTG